jgi:hypothetical protein
VKRFIQLLSRDPGTKGNISLLTHQWLNHIGTGNRIRGIVQTRRNTERRIERLEYSDPLEIPNREP